MIKSPFHPKKYSKSTTKVLHKKQIISGSGHKTAKIFVNINNGCVCRVPTSGSFCKYSTSLVLNNNLWELKKKKHKYNAIIYTPVNVVLHNLLFASFITNNIFLPLMFPITHRKTSNFDMGFQKFSYKSLVLRSWSFSKKWSAMKDLSNDI